METIINLPKRFKYEPDVTFCKECKHNKPRSKSCKKYPLKDSYQNHHICDDFEEKVGK